ncbi:MAG: VCBS repeat-containing protein [Planctomycetes bacterium]|nr:VCBS repeat-containing protein [Planctomycetota bacterium]MCB9916619.1 VCBS repeat-containing protein [Planctomycetota bacterium]
MRAFCILATAAVLAPVANSQLTDLQSGRNFPTAAAAFGTGRSENIDPGDVDNDGDYDAVVANGGDGAAQLNTIYINNGGIQGGVIGTFSDQSATRFVHTPADTSRDCELVDFDADGDLDVYISNRGTTVNGGEPSRAYINQGGLQFGSVGYFFEGTDDFWGTLISVPLTDEVGVQDHKGPFRDFTCDCDFGDLDDDGDIDLFHSSYGPNISGDHDSRIFMNDGAGVFDEHWPWVDPGGDIKLHTIDIDLTDLDSDYDLDVFASSRDSQARVYRNNLYGGTGAGALFTDITQSALLDQGAGLAAGSNYESEYGDMDGDGDFDVWAKNYGPNTTDVTLENIGGLKFQKADWIRGDPAVDENEVDFFDYDSDGDLDTFVANFGGTNWIYQNGTNDGVDVSLGKMFRTGTTSGGSLASWPEDPTSGNGGTTLDADCADMDGDGDPDVLLSNDGNQQNRYWENVLGVPDTHAPTFQLLTVQGDKSDGTETPIHAQLRDNAAYYMVSLYNVDLIYTVNGGPAHCVQMFSQGSMQFRGVIPAAVNGTVAYHVEATDDAGNTAVSPTHSYVQTSAASSLWAGLGCGTQGVKGDPYLKAWGDLTAGSTATLDLEDAAPNAINALFISASSTAVPFKGGLLWTFPVAVTLNVFTDAGGQTLVQFPWPAGIPTGTQLFWQYAIQDASNPTGLTISNAVRSTTP